MKRIIVILIIFICLFGLGGVKSTSASCTARTYTECEEGNATTCLGTGTGTTHNVPKGDRAQVTVNSNCTYSCKNLGPCLSAPTNTSVPATPTNTPIPGVPTDTPIPQGDAYVSLVVRLPGIGALHGGNSNPGSPTRQVTLYLYTADQDPSNVNNQPVLVNSTMHLDSTSGNQTFGYFNNPKINVGALNGDYQIFIKSNQYLRAQILPSGTGSSTNTFTLIGGQITSLPQIAPLAGDIFPPPATGATNYGDDTLDISDYNMLLSCYGSAAATTACPSKSAADLNDDGVIDGIDYNIMLRSFFTLQNGH